MEQQIENKESIRKKGTKEIEDLQITIEKYKKGLENIYKEIATLERKVSKSMLLPIIKAKHTHRLKKNMRKLSAPISKRNKPIPPLPKNETAYYHCYHNMKRN